MLLVFSAALVGALIFGRPVLWYLDGRKHDSLLLLTETLAILFAVTVAVFLILMGIVEENATTTAIRRELLNQLVELHHSLGTFQSTRVAHYFFMGIAATIELDVGFGVPFRIRDEFVGFLAAQKLFRNAALLLDHERSALRFPDPCGIVDFRRINCDVDQTND
jgi:hypothetical protein